jgi:hypothetical protein
LHLACPEFGCRSLRICFSPRAPIQTGFADSRCAFTGFALQRIAELNGLHGVSFENIGQRTVEDSLCVAVKVFVLGFASTGQD